MLRLLTCVLVFLLSSAWSATDLTRQPNTYGSEVVEAVVNIIRESCIFAQDKRFLRRLSYVESHDGTDPKTYRAGYNGGIWQVDETAFLSTKNQASLSSKYQTIRTVLGIDWNSVQWADLRKPLYSGLAAALFTILQSGSKAMSWKAEEQGKFWETNFHGGSSATNFTRLAEILDLGCRPHQMIDLVFVVDRSASLSRDDLLRTKYFINNVIDGFPVNASMTRVGVVSYATHARVEFYLNSHSDKAHVKSAVDAINYDPGSTATGEGINLALSDVFSAAHGSRPTAVKVMIVITDGQSNDPISTQHAAEALQKSGIVSFSVGVGPSINTGELSTIATDPECTHTYQVNSFEEIRFLTEEIQKATCIAPLYITHTYTCNIPDCPPLAVLTGPTGVTIETNVTCGGMNVYTGFNNPYPSVAQHEVAQTSLPGQPTQYYYTSVGGKTLYINIADTQKYLTTHGSQGCIATITPYHGDHTDHQVYVKCFQNGAEIQCKDDYFNCTEKWNFPNPCTKANLLAGKDKFPHPYFNNKFLMCDLTGKVLIVICPPGELFEADCNQCIGNNTVASASCTKKVDPAVANPCSRANILAGKLYFPFPNSLTKYIHCDIWGHPWERECLPGMEWEQAEVTCIVPAAYSPCRHHAATGQLHFPHLCDPHLYIQCDLNGQSFVRQCELDYIFYPASRTCVPQGLYSATAGLVNTCAGGTTYQPYTVQPTNPGGATPVYTPGGYKLSTQLHVPPCTLDNVRAMKLYFPYLYNQHQYIQCDLNGRQYLMTCSGSGRDWYDPYSHTCVDGPVAVDGLLTNPPPAVG